MLDTLREFKADNKETLKNIKTAEITTKAKKETRELKQKIGIDRNKITEARIRELKTIIEQQGIRPVEKLKNGNIRVPYDRNGEKRNFDINPTTQKVIVRKYRYIQELKKKGWKKEQTLSINLSSKAAFLKSFKGILDRTIGSNRKRISKKGMKAWSMITSNKKGIEVTKKGLKRKPIDLEYKNILPDQSISFYEKLPDRNSPAGRILRCLRYKKITDAAEKRYGIPEGLLLAMMAQEGYGDPTIPNFLQDGGVGLIHIQATNAANYGLKTLKRYNTNMVDKRHGRLVNQYLKKYNNDPKYLQKFDDRFHPIMAIDVAARFLVNRKRQLEHTVGKNEKANIRLYALKRYGPGNPPAPGGFKKYANKVANYRQLLQKTGFIKNPSFITTMKPAQRKTIEQRYKHRSLQFKANEETIRTYTKKRKIAKIGTKDVNYRGYIHYFNQLHDKNYEGEKYEKLGKY